MNYLDLLDLDRVIRLGFHRFQSDAKVVSATGTIDVATSLFSAHSGMSVGPPGEDAGANLIVLHDVVTDVSQIEAATRSFRAAGFAGELSHVAVFSVPEASSAVNIVLQEVASPVVAGWRIMSDPVLRRACLDIDGILCLDPTEEENDDGDRYVKFLSEAVPRWKPTEHVGWLVTSRLERYRAETEAWLKAQNVAYGELIMLDLPSAEARRAAGSHGSFKAEVYASLDANLFVESELWQAEVIAQLSGKPVLCLPEGRVIRHADVPEPPLARRLRRRIGGTLRRVGVLRP